MSKQVIAVLGPDRPGIIAAVSKLLFQLDCNIENVSQTILQTEFSGIFIVTTPEGLPVETLRGRLEEELSALSLHVHVKAVEPAAGGSLQCPCEAFVITTQGPDRKGLVAGITEIIARYGVNVTRLQAVFKGGEDPGNNIMIYEVDVPGDIDPAAFHRDLRERAAELDLEISLQHRNIFEAINRI